MIFNDIYIIHVWSSNGYFLFVFGLPYLTPVKVPCQCWITFLQGQGFDSLVVGMASFAFFYLQRLKAGHGSKPNGWGKWSIMQFAAGLAWS